MGEEKRPESQILNELESLGRQLTSTVRALWESEESQKLRQDIREGFVELASEVDSAIKSAQDSETAHEFRGQVQETIDKARESDVTRQVEDGLATGLRQLNQELAKLIASLEKSGAGASSEKSGAPEPPTQEEGGGQA
jgi:BMFP domain-containing protein YqiC